MSTGVSIVETPVDIIATDSRSGGQEKSYGSQSAESLSPITIVLAALALDPSAHRLVSQLADRAIDIRLVTFDGYVHDQELLLARQVRAADDTRTSSANRVRPETEGHRARSRGDLAGCTRIAGLQRSDVLHESRHHLPAADDHPARWRACPRVALRNDRRTRGNPDHVLSGGPLGWGIRGRQWQLRPRWPHRVGASGDRPWAEVDGVTRPWVWRGGRSLPGGGARNAGSGHDSRIFPQSLLGEIRVKRYPSGRDKSEPNASSSSMTRCRLDESVSGSWPQGD